MGMQCGKLLHEDTEDLEIANSMQVEDKNI